MDDYTKALSEEIKEVKSDVSEIKKDLKELLEVKNKIAGGLKTIAVTGSVCAFILGSVITIVRENRSDIIANASTILKMQTASQEIPVNFCPKVFNQ